jgi:hypothetical protein
MTAKLGNGESSLRREPTLNMRRAFLMVLYGVCCVTALFIIGRVHPIRAAIGLLVMGLMFLIFGEWQGAVFIGCWLGLISANIAAAWALKAALDRSSCQK